MKKESAFSSPGGAEMIDKSIMAPPANKFAEPGGATSLPTGRGPNTMPSEFTGDTLGGS